MFSPTPTPDILSSGAVHSNVKIIELSPGV
jgi:hypothetical protein